MSQVSRKVLLHIRNTIKRRTFFIRLLTTTLLAAFIPLTIMCVQLIRRESAGVEKDAATQLETMTEAVAAQFDEYANVMYRVGTKISLKAIFNPMTLAASIQNELDALEYIKGYRDSMPFVKDFALYIPETDAFYTPNGKMNSSGFVKMLLGMNEGEFYEMMHSVNTGAFAEWDARRGSILYILPVRIGAFGMMNRYVIYSITADTLTDAMYSLLAGRYAIADISDMSGKVLYQSAASLPKDRACNRKSSHGYGLTLCNVSDRYRENMDSIVENARLLSWMNIALCLVLIVMVALFNYRPLDRLVRNVHKGSESEAASELDSVLSSYSHLAEEKTDLSYQLYEKNVLIYDRMMENLLSGQKLSQSDMRMLKLNMPYYRVVCAKSEDVEDASAIIGSNVSGSAIFAIEMYADNQLAFVCGCADDSEASVAALSQALRTRLHSKDIPLGYSTAYDMPERLSLAYLEAGRALVTESENPDRIGHAVRRQIYLLNEDTQELEELTCAIKTGDDFMFRFAEETLRKIQQNTVSRASQRYACYQLIEMYRRLCAEFGMELDMERLAEIVQESGFDKIREQFLHELTEARDKRKQAQEQANNIVYSNIMQYIGENFTNPLFSLNDVADYLGVSIYTASRMLKTLTGINFRKYLNDMRLERAKELLITTVIPIGDVSDRAGFTSSSYFIKIFKEDENMTPSAYRELMQNSTR